MNSAEHIATEPREIREIRDEAAACGLTTPQLNNPVLAAGFALPASEGPGANESSSRPAIRFHLRGRGAPDSHV